MDKTVEEKLAELHSRLRLHDGLRFETEEYPEQCMAMQFVSPDSTVLEIGGNIGRNSCVIASILNDSSRQVVFESDQGIAARLEANRNLNGLSFHVEACAISKRPLLQAGINTYVLDPSQYQPWSPVRTMTWDAVKSKYPHLHFDVLVADCEGALAYIVHDEPDFFSSFKTVIMENDYLSLQPKLDVDASLRAHGFNRVFVDSLPRSHGAYTLFPVQCAEAFYEVWQR